MKLARSLAHLFTAGLIASASVATAEDVEITDGKVKVKGANGQTVEITDGLIAGTGDEDGVVGEDGKATVITGNNKKVKQACVTGKTHFTVTGNNNKVTLTGECAKVTVTGNNNKVHVDNVGVLVMTGNANNATYLGGLSGKAPKITRTGNGNVVEKIEAAQ